MLKGSRSRAVVVAALVVAIGGCTSIRQGLGLYQRTADKGVTLGGKPQEGFAPPGSSGSETTPAPPGTHTAEAKVAKQNLPTGLAGDKEHRAYTTDAPH